MKPLYLALGSATLLLAACNQTPPATEQATPPATTPVVAESSVAAPAAARPDSTVASLRTVAVASAAAAVLSEVTTLKLSFVFKPAPNPDDAAHPRTSVQLLLQGTKPQDIDLGKFAGKPDVVNAAKAKAANFPAGMLMGFRSYSAATGTSSDLAVLNEDARHLRIVQRRVEETAPEGGKFETAREIVLSANTKIEVVPIPKSARK